MTHLPNHLHKALSSGIAERNAKLQAENTKLKDRLLEVQEYTGSCKDSCSHCRAVYNAVKGKECQPTKPTE